MQRDLWPAVYLGAALLLAVLLWWGSPARCDSCPGWPCRINADCDTGSACVCAGTRTGVGFCVGGR